ncbi:MAG TPA: homocysteine S-methyltransferase family protein, partial [Candidatus Brocadiia bacterium]|nr:homocysteine S-methyltransferase family protein [Candidatus Brocadiia bacterium]
GNRFKLEKTGLAGRLSEINRAAARLSLEAASGKALVFASVGGTGEFMEPLGVVSEQQMVDCYAEQISALAEEGAHGVCIETFTDLNEAMAALRAAKQCGRLATVVSLTYDKGAAGYATMMGVRPEKAAQELDAAGADIIGANCGAGMENMIEIIRQLRAATRRPLWAKPNAGLPQLVDGRTVFRETPEQMSARFDELAKAGARFIGGCCGTTPDHIRRFAAAAKAFVATNAALLAGDDLKTE